MKFNQGFIIFFTIPLKQYELYSFELHFAEKTCYNDNSESNLNPSDI